MQVSAIYINVYRYDIEMAKICIASIRYWYPAIPIYLIKDYSAGVVDSRIIERTFNVGLLKLDRTRLGWGYGKLEPLFLQPRHSFLILDPDAVMTGRVLDRVEEIDVPFIVDEEIPERTRFNEIYYNLDRIHELDPAFFFPGYSFNSGQWFGTSGILTRSDFELSLEWSEPPRAKYPDIVFNGDQAHFNFAVHRLEQQNKIKLHRMPLMVYPIGDQADFIQLSAIAQKKDDHPYIIHWAGMKYDAGADLARQDIIDFYAQYYYSLAGESLRVKDRMKRWYLKYEKKLRHLIPCIVP